MKSTLFLIPIFFLSGCGKSIDGLLTELQQQGVDGEVVQRNKSDSGKFKTRLIYQKDPDYRIFLYEYANAAKAEESKNSLNGKVQMDKFKGIRNVVTRHYYGKFGVAVTIGDEKPVLEVVKNYVAK